MARKTTDQEHLREIAARMIASGGCEALSMRNLAAEAGVALGTLYNYYPGKETIVSDVTEHLWMDALAQIFTSVKGKSFMDQMEEMMKGVREIFHSSAGKLMRSLGTTMPSARGRMDHMLTWLEGRLLSMLEEDPTQREHGWSYPWSKETFIQYVIQNMLWLIHGSDEACAMFQYTLRSLLTKE